MPKPDYDTTLARIAGNIAAGLVGRDAYHDAAGPRIDAVAYDALEIAVRLVRLVRLEPGRQQAEADRG